MSKSFKENVADIAIFTGITADIIAIGTIIYSILAYLQVFPGPKFQTDLFNINVGFLIPAREFTFTLAFYGFLAVFYSISQSIEIEASQGQIYGKDVVRYLRQLSLCICFLVVSTIAILAVFKLISVSDALAIEAVAFFSTLTFLFSWTSYDTYYSARVKFKGIGLWFLTWIPLVWVCLLTSPSANYIDQFLTV